MHELIRTKLALWVFQLHGLTQEQRVNRLEQIKTLNHDRLEAIALDMLDRGLDTMTDLSVLD